MHECPKCHKNCQCDNSSGSDGGGPKGLGSIAPGACAHDCAKAAAEPVTARYAASVAHGTDKTPVA